MKQVAKPAPNAKESQQGDLSAALTAGDITPPCILRSLDDKTVDIRVDAIAGNPQVLLFAIPNLDDFNQPVIAFEQRFTSFVCYQPALAPAPRGPARTQRVERLLTQLRATSSIT